MTNNTGKITNKSGYISAYDRIKLGEFGKVEPSYPAYPEAAYTMVEPFSGKYPFITDKNALALAGWIETHLIVLGLTAHKLLPRFALQSNYFVTVKKKYIDNPDAVTGNIQYATRVRLAALRDALNEYVDQHNRGVEEARKSLPTSGKDGAGYGSTGGKPVQEELVASTPVPLLIEENETKIHNAVLDAQRHNADADINNMVNRISMDTIGMRKTLGLAMMPTLHIIDKNGQLTNRLLSNISDTLSEMRDLLKGALQ